MAVPFDYPGVAQDALDLIEEFGRQVTFVLKPRTATDITKPWRGGKQVAVDPDVPDPDEPSQIEDIFAAIVPFENQDEPNSIVRRFPTATAYVAHLSFPDGTEVENLDSIEDGDTTWRICKVETINPGSVKVLYTFYLEA